MTEPTFGFDGARTEQELQRWAAGMTAKAERYQEMQRQVTGVTSAATSRDGVVTITVDSGGAVTDIRFTDGISRLTGDALSRLVSETMRAAQSRITDQVAEIMRTTVGDDHETVNAVVSNYRERFPEPEPENPEPRGRRRGDIGEIDDDDFGDNPFRR